MSQVNRASKIHRKELKRKKHREIKKITRRRLIEKVQKIDRERILEFREFKRFKRAEKQRIRQRVKEADRHHTPVQTAPIDNSGFNLAKFAEGSSGSSAVREESKPKPQSNPDGFDKAAWGLK